jgi:hypothetical protein
MTAYTTGAHFRHAVAYLCGELSKALPGDYEILRPRRGLLAWHRGRVCRWILLYGYNDIIYRFRTDHHFASELPRRLRRSPPDCYGTELSFHASEAEAIKGADLVAFVDSVFEFPKTPERIYRWSLFLETDGNYPLYAWSALGRREQNKREQERREQHPDAIRLVRSGKEPTS